jgi:hypothetical protein
MKILIGILVLGATIASAQGQIVGLFQDAPASPMRKGTDPLSAFRADTTVKEARLVALNREALTGEYAGFNPFPGKSEVLRFTSSRFQGGPSGKEIRVGVVEGASESTVTLFIRDSYIRGFVRLQGDIYMIEPTANGLYTIIRYDVTKVPQEF